MPGHSYGEWSLVKILWRPGNDDGSEIKVGALVFIRPLTLAELRRATRRKNVWGMKVPGEQWALIMGSRSDGDSNVNSSKVSTDPALSVGV